MSAASLAWRGIPTKCDRAAAKCTDSTLSHLLTRNALYGTKHNSVICSYYGRIVMFISQYLILGALSQPSTHTPSPMLQAIRISLVIPTYNRGSLIAETIDSALEQKHPFAEIIVVDDGSTDHTAEVLSRYGDRITVIRLPNGGVQRARNAGVHAASSPWVMFCDSDDLIRPDLNSHLVQWLESDPRCDAIYCNFVTFDERAEQSDKFSQAPASFFAGARRSGHIWHDIPDLYARTVAYQPLFFSGNIIRKALYEAIGGFDTHFNGVGGEDWSLPCV